MRAKAAPSSSTGPAKGFTAKPATLPGRFVAGTLDGTGEVPSGQPERAASATGSGGSAKQSGASGSEPALAPRRTAWPFAESSKRTCFVPGGGHVGDVWRSQAASGYL